MAAVLLFSSLAPGVSAASTRLATQVATVDASALRLRSAPSTSGSTLAYASRGEYVVIYGKSGQWYRVSYNLTDGYMHESYLDTYSRRNVELGYGRVSGNGVNVRSGPGTSHSSLARANTGEEVYIIGFNNFSIYLSINNKRLAYTYNFCYSSYNDAICNILSQGYEKCL